MLPADDPREKDRIPPAAGCPWRRFSACNVDAGLYGLLWSMLSQWVFRINRIILCRIGVDARVRGYVSWLLTFVFEPQAAALLGHNARQVDISGCPSAMRTEKSCPSAPHMSVCGRSARLR